MMAKKQKTDGVQVFCTFTKMEQIEKLVPNPRNPNKHPDEQVEILGRLIKAHGWRSPVVVSSRSGFIVKGHGRLLAAQAIGEKEVPVDVQAYATEAEEWADLIADNRVQELSEFQFSDVAAILKELEGKIDLGLTAFKAHEIESLMAADWSPAPVKPLNAGDGHGDLVVVKITKEAKRLLDLHIEKTEASDASAAIIDLCKKKRSTK